MIDKDTPPEIPSDEVIDAIYAQVRDFVMRMSLGQEMGIQIAQRRASGESALILTLNDYRLDDNRAVGIVFAEVLNSDLAKKRYRYWNVATKQWDDAKDAPTPKFG